MLRSLFGSTADYSDDRIAYWYLMRMDWDAVPTVYRWSTYNNEGDTISVDVGDGDGAQNWDCTKVWDIGDYEQGQSSLLSITDLWFGNADYSFSNMLNARVNGSIKGVRFSIYRMEFDKDDLTMATGFQGTWLAYDGEGDREEVSHEVRVSLLPYKYPLSVKFPRWIFSPAFGFNNIPKVNASFPWGNSSASAPNAPDNGGSSPPSTGTGGGTPPPNIGDTHRQTVQRVDRSRSSPVVTPTRGGPDSGRNPRTVNR